MLPSNTTTIQKYLDQDIEKRSRLQSAFHHTLYHNLSEMKYYNLYPYNQVGFHPVNPVFVTYLNNMECLTDLPFVTCVDSAPRLYTFFQKNKPSPKHPIFLVNLELAGIIPEYWKEKVAFFSVGVNESTCKTSQ